MSSRTADGLRLAAGTLTALPVRAPSRVDRGRAAVAMSLAPLAVLPLGAAVAVVAFLGKTAALPPLLVAALTLTALTLGSRAMHLDGLADTADGLAASYDRDRALEVMRLGDTGPAGAAALVLVLVVQVAALSAVLTRPWGWVVASVLVCASRAALAVTCARGVPPARPEGLGEAVAGSVPRLVGAVAWCAGAAAVTAALVLAGHPWWHGPVAAVIALASVLVLVIRCHRRLGGITGDVLGAAVEVAFTALLVASAAR